MYRGGLVRRALLLCLVVVAASPSTVAQMGDSQDNTIVPLLPPPLPRKETPKGAPLYEPIVPEIADLEWGLPDGLLVKLRERTEIYRDYARRFTCDETARLAEYDQSGGVTKEREKRYAYLLYQGESGDRLREYRQEFAKDGKLRAAEVEDEERFPPAYAWVYLFSDFNSPYFSYRLLGTRFDGFDYVHEIQFRGSLTFTSGKDIRQWEGKILVDAFFYTPIEIVAEPVAQRERLEAQYRIYSSSMNIVGLRTKPKPLGYKASIQFGLRRDDLTFPTELRYDTKRAVSPTQLIDVKASTRSYERYLFTYVEATQEVGDVQQD